MIMLLSGPPGVGKTLTAESVAENMKVPLYMMSAGDLGTRTYEVEQNLSNILEMCTKWDGCILLIDEADVFLEQRSANNIERNQLVSSKSRSQPVFPFSQPTNRSLPPRPGILLRHSFPHHQPRGQHRRSLPVAHPHLHGVQTPIDFFPQTRLGQFHRCLDAGPLVQRGGPGSACGVRHEWKGD